MVSTLPQYEGWEQDVRIVAQMVAEAFSAGKYSEASRRLLAVLPPPKCAKTLQHGSGAFVMLSTGNRIANKVRSGPYGQPDHAEVVPITCALPPEHDGPHIPQVPPEAWR